MFNFWVEKCTEKNLFIDSSFIFADFEKSIINVMKIVNIFLS